MLTGIVTGTRYVEIIPQVERIPVLQRAVERSSLSELGHAPTYCLKDTLHERESDFSLRIK